MLQLEAIEMHKLSQIIEKNGGKVLEYKTDCVVFHHPSDVFPFELIDEKNVKGFYFDDDEKVPKYKMEKFGGFMSCERKPRYIRTDKFELVKKSFRIEKDVDDNIYLQNEMKELTIPKSKFQSWFHVAYCITSHKSQGETIKVPYTIHDWDRMSETCKYVSLSRGTCWENVNLL